MNWGYKGFFFKTVYKFLGMEEVVLWNMDLNDLHIKLCCETWTSMISTSSLHT